MSVPDQIIQHMTCGAPQQVWTANNFVDIGTRAAVDVALHRLAKDGTIRRIDRGLYDVPNTNKLTKKLTPPDHNAVIAAVASRDGARVLVDGMTAANNLGLTNAVPAHVTVLTDARIRPIILGNLTITFRQAAPSRLVWAGRPAANIVQALTWLRDVVPMDRDRITARLKGILNDPDRGPPIQSDLKDGLSKLPSWMVPMVKDLIASPPNAAAAVSGRPPQ